MSPLSKNGTVSRLFNGFPPLLIDALHQLERHSSLQLYITGGTVRDWLLGRKPVDLDISVQRGAIQCCRKLIDILGGGALVQLGTTEEEAARVVWQGIYVDFSAFRCGAQSINEELHHRDFTINGMALAFLGNNGHDPKDIIDPLGGRADLDHKILRCCPGAFVDDPLRMLRGFRLQAELGFIMDDTCREEIRRYGSAIGTCASERILGELERILATECAAGVCRAMAENELLYRIIPELKDGVGLQQPGYHHEDVFHHGLLTLECVDRVMVSPEKFFGRYCSSIVKYLANGKHRRYLRWSALFHDLGKPATCLPGTARGSRTTFYNHDRVGRQMFLEVALRLRMSKGESKYIGQIIEMHMHPFHLSNVRRKGQLSRKALLKLCKKAGDKLPGLFVLAMADSLASQGELKPVGMEDELALLYDEVQEANENHIQPALHGKRLVTGNDLQELFGLQPGPLFRVILEELDLARVEQRVESRGEAILWLKEYLNSMEN